MDPSPRLIVKDSDGSKRVVKLVEGETVSIGRTASNTIPIADTASSRNHCQVAMTEDGWTLQDLGSRNGTQLNKAKVTVQALKHGDVITIGKARIKFVSGPATPSEPNLKAVMGKGAAPSAAEAPETVTMPKLPSGGKAPTLSGAGEGYYLVQFVGDDEVTFPIESETTSIGRAGSNDITIVGDAATSCSGKHAELAFDGSRWQLRDLGSTNGTKVGGIGIESHTLKSGDLIEFGRAQFIFRAESFGDEASIGSDFDAAGSGLPVPGQAGAGAGGLGFVLPFIGTVVVIGGVVGALAFYFSSSIKAPPPKVAAVPGNLLSEEAFSFEEASSGRAAGWSGFGDGAMVGPGDSGSGKLALSLSQGANTEPLPVRAVAYDPSLARHVAPALVFKVRAKVKHETGDGQVGMRLRWLSTEAADYQVDHFTPLLASGSGWRELSGSFVAPAGCDDLQLACVVVGQVQGAQFDEVVLTRVDSSTLAAPPTLDDSLGRALFDRVGRVTIQVGNSLKASSELVGGRIQLRAPDGELRYDQALLVPTTPPTREGETVRFAGTLPPLRGGPEVTLTATVTARDGSFVLGYRLDGAPEGTTAHLRFACAQELDGKGPLALDSDGALEKLRGAFARPLVSLLRWKGSDRHLGLYPQPAGVLRYEKEPQLSLELIQTQLAGEGDAPQLGARVRLSFQEDRPAMLAAFEKAKQLEADGKDGQAFRALQEILITFPFVDGAADADARMAAITARGASLLRRLKAGYERARYFGRPVDLQRELEGAEAFIVRFAGMPVEREAKALQTKIEDELASARSRAAEKGAATLMRRAQDFTETGMKSLAAMAYQRLLERFPDAPQADEARAALAKLKGESR